MTAFKKLTRKNARAVLVKIADEIEGDKERAEMWVEELTRLLDDLLNQDAFGTEGQLDPRGDPR